MIVSYICPLMYMNNPLCGSMPVITSSNKLRTYTTARYYTDDEILEQITGCADGASVAASVAKRDGSESDAKGGDR